MQCQESKKILDAYVDNEVDVVRSAALEEHVAGCPDCAQTLEGRSIAVVDFGCKRYHD